MAGIAGPGFEANAAWNWVGCQIWKMGKVFGTASVDEVVVRLRRHLRRWGSF